MKYLFLILLAFQALEGRCGNVFFEKLCEVNKCWRNQKDAALNALQPDSPANETKWIALHLRLVEQTLRQRSTQRLSARQAANRLDCLSYLNQYWHKERFPGNTRYTRRTPIFIDDQNNFCAVGYLLKTSGYEALARKISACGNLAYVGEMNYPELNRWARDHGFTLNELAWIQPGYPPKLKASPVGAGVNGEVMELFPDDASSRLYVGGNFTRADDSIPANNIASLSEAGGVYTWRRMDSGLKGTVYAITKYKGRIFAAGSFTIPGSGQPGNVAYWNDTFWTAAGCLTGTVYDLAVMNGELYAAGSLEVCTRNSATATLARWNDTVWRMLPGPKGSANTMFVSDSTLVLGGALLYNGAQLNVVKWSEKSGYQTFTGGIANEVKSFEMFSNTLYAGCKRTSTSEPTNIVVQKNGNQWQAIADSQLLEDFRAYEGPISVNALCTNGSLLMLGGSFKYSPPGIGTYGTNCFSMPILSDPDEQWFIVDSAINKMVIFKNTLIAGGRFRIGSRIPPPAVILNGMARVPISPPLSVPKFQTGCTFELSPNPVAEGGSISVWNNFSATRYTMADITGRTIGSGNLRKAMQAIDIPHIAPGTYFITIWNEQGTRAVRPVQVK